MKKKKNAVKALKRKYKRSGKYDFIKPVKKIKCANCVMCGGCRGRLF